MEYYGDEFLEDCCKRYLELAPAGTTLKEVDMPCMDETTLLCAPFDSTAAGADVCPTAHTDCTASDAFDTDSVQVLEIKTHSHDTIEVISPPGFGRRHRVDVQVGVRSAVMASSSLEAEERYLGYLPPSVMGFQSE